MAKRHKKIKRTKVEQLDIDLNRWLARRDAAIEMLIKSVDRLKQLQRACARLEKPRKPVVLSEAAMCGGEKAQQRIVDDAIPDFLRRTKDVDAAAREAIKAEQEDRKKNKARVRIEKLKAKQAGDLKRMPLSGRDALAAIRNG